MATSGTFTGSRGGTNGYGPYLTLSWSRIETDIAGNRSKIRLTLNLVASHSLYFSASKTGVLHGTSFTYTGGFSGTGTKTLRTQDVWVSHNADGTKSQSFSATFNIAVNWSGTWVSSISVSGTANIDTIPRASDFTAASLSNSTLNTDTAVTVNYTLSRKSTSFSQTMTLKLGSTVIKTWTTSSTGALTQGLSTAEVNTIIRHVPNATSGTLSLTMQTKSGTTNIGSPISRNISFSLNANIKPSASGLSVSIYGSGRDKSINKYVQSLTRVTSSFTRSAGYGASISSSTIVIRRQSDGGNSQTIASNSGTTANPVNLSGTYIATGTVKDSRGRSTSVSTTFTVESYSAPRISTFNVSRSTPTTSVKATINVGWTPLGTSNPTNVSIVGVDNSKVSKTHYTLNGSTAGSINTTQTYTGQSDASSYTYTITLTDSFGKTATAKATVGTSFVEMTISKGQGVGIGKVHERGALDIAGSVYTDYRYVFANLENPGATAYLAYVNNMPVIRYGGTGVGSADGFEILGPGDIPKFKVDNNGTIHVVNDFILPNNNSIYTKSPNGTNRRTLHRGTDDKLHINVDGVGSTYIWSAGNHVTALEVIGKANIQGEGIEINWTTPYIDLKDTYSEDYDLRIIRSSDNSLSLVFTGQGTKHRFYPNGTKSGGSIEIDGKNLGMSPIDSPQVLIEYIEFDVSLNEVGVKVFIDDRFLKSVGGKFAVFPNNGVVIEKGVDYVTLKGEGVADIRIVGERIEYEDVFYDDLNIADEELTFTKSKEDI